MTEFDVASRTILLVKHGSTAYGTTVAGSDVDLKGVAIAPMRFYLGFSKNFEQEEELVRKGHPNDKVVYDIRKFMKLASECNPNIIEVLHVSPEDIVSCDEFGQKLIEIRDTLICQTARFRFAGYAKGQLSRIKTHRRWLLNSEQFERPAPTRAEFDLPPIDEKRKREIDAAFATIQKRLDEWNVDMMGLDESEKINLQTRLAELLGSLKFSRDDVWNAAATSTFDDRNLVARLQREHEFANRVEDWKKYHKWKLDRNPERAALEARCGFDSKHGGHLYRLMVMCLEILEGKGVIVKRPDAARIRRIRNGEIGFDELMEEVDRLDAACEAAFRVTKLPKKPDLDPLDGICAEAIMKYNHSKNH